MACSQWHPIGQLESLLGRGLKKRLLGLPWSESELRRLRKRSAPRRVENRTVGKGSRHKKLGAGVTRRLPQSYSRSIVSFQGKLDHARGLRSVHDPHVSRPERSLGVLRFTRLKALRKSDRKCSFTFFRSKVLLQVRFMFTPAPPPGAPGGQLPKVPTVGAE